MIQTRPIIFMDLEATGADTSRDRIVEIAFIRRAVDGTITEKIERVNPGMKIPSEVIALHGITNEALVNCPTFGDIAPDLIEFLHGADFAGYGVMRFDIPMLTEEFRRCSIPFSLEGRSIIDGLIIFHQKEPRDLKAALKFYCGKELIGAHGAKADAIAAMDVLMGQLVKYEDLPKEPHLLHTYCKKQDERYVDSQRKFCWRDGEAAFNFGKHKGELLREMVKSHRDYIEWIVNDAKFAPDAVEICWKALRGEYPKRAPKPA
jgi:DNA polymerase-3 subunit epsilon